MTHGDEPSAPPDAVGSFGHKVQVLAGIVAPTTILAALFLYFGYVWTDSFYEFYGVDAATLQFSTQDYMLRSAQALYIPVGAIVLLGLLLLWLHPAVTSRLLRGRRRPWFPWVMKLVVGLGIALLVAGVGVTVVPGVLPQNSLLGPLSILLGVLLITYSRAYLSEPPTRGRYANGFRENATKGFLLAVVTLCMFWLANSFAQQYGKGMAVNLSQQITLRPAVIMDTTESLFLQLPGVEESVLPQATESQKYHYRYRGLRLLAQAGNRMFFVPSDWLPGSGQVLMLSTEDDIRLQFAAG